MQIVFKLKFQARHDVKILFTLGKNCLEWVRWGKIAWPKAVGMTELAMAVKA